MTVVAADYIPLKPYTTEWLNIGNGQRYDVIVEMNQAVSSYFLRAVAQTGCPSVCANTGLGTANGIIQYEGVPPELPTSNFGNRTAASFATCIDEPLASLVPYLEKSGGDAATFQASQKPMPAGLVAATQVSPDHRVFLWFINNGVIDVNYTQPSLQTLYENPDYFTGVNSTNATNLISNAITLNSKNEWVYFVIANQFFASHPMHLHGHDMSILGQGVGTFSDVSTLNFGNPLRRDTVMLQGSRGPGNPSGYTIIGFETDNPGAWLMHCHIVWHVEGGLALQFIERPDDIDTARYVNNGRWQNECSALKDWEGTDEHRQPHQGQSGLKRGLGTHEGLGYGDVVRRHLHEHKKRAF